MGKVTGTSECTRSKEPSSRSSTVTLNSCTQTNSPKRGDRFNSCDVAAYQSQACFDIAERSPEIGRIRYCDNVEQTR